jgi:hypothetical protein
MPRIMRNSYGELVDKLEPNQVFVFGSNPQGFHGGGAAGYASFGVYGNHWRELNYDNKPNGWKGKWNVKGVGEGFQEGTEGKSYALPTVKFAGGKQSLTMDQIIANNKKMYTFASNHPELEFLVAGSSAGGKSPLCGYSHEQLAYMYGAAGPIPENVVFSTSYSQMIFQLTQP